MAKLSLLDVAKATKPGRGQPSRGKRPGDLKRTTIHYYSEDGYELVVGAIAERYGVSRSRVLLWAAKVLYALLVREAGFPRLGLGMDEWL